MKGIYLFSGIIFWFGSLLDQETGGFIFLLWIIAFILTWYGWSILYSFICLIATVSYKYMSIDSIDYMESSILPWLFGVSITIAIVALVVRNPYIISCLPGSDTGGDSNGGDGC